MNLAIQDKRVRYFTVPAREVLEGFLDRNFGAMPAVVRARAIEGWLKAMERTGGRVFFDWQASFRAYANGTWRSILLGRRS